MSTELKVVAPGQILYSMESSRAIDRFQDVSGNVLSEMATKRAISQGRHLVTADDVLSCIPEALRKILGDLEPPATGR